jgi:hypothetical protein
LSYVDALFDRDKDRIHVVERINGVRKYQEYPANYIFYYEDPKGKFRSIFDDPVGRFSCRNNKEFRKELRMYAGKTTFEADINPVFRCLAENFLDQTALSYTQRSSTLKLTLIKFVVSPVQKKRSIPLQQLPFTWTGWTN